MWMKPVLVALLALLAMTAARKHGNGKSKQPMSVDPGNGDMNFVAEDERDDDDEYDNDNDEYDNDDDEYDTEDDEYDNDNDEGYYRGSQDRQGCTDRKRNRSWRRNDPRAREGKSGHCKKQGMKKRAKDLKPSKKICHQVEMAMDFMLNNKTRHDDLLRWMLKQLYCSCKMARGKKPFVHARQCAIDQGSVLV